MKGRYKVQVKRRQTRKKQSTSWGSKMSGTSTWYEPRPHLEKLPLQHPKDSLKRWERGTKTRRSKNRRYVGESISTPYLFFIWLVLGYKWVSKRHSYLLIVFIVFQIDLFFWKVLWNYKELRHGIERLIFCLTANKATETEYCSSHFLSSILQD